MSKKIDRLIAKHVFNKEEIDYDPNTYKFGVYTGVYKGIGFYLPNFSTDISKAFLVVEEMSKKWHFSLDKKGCIWIAYFERGDSNSSEFEEHWIENEVVSMAICLAVLSALGIKQRN